MGQTVQCLLAEGYRYHTLGHLDEALRLYEQALGIAPDSFDVSHLIGVLYLQQSQYQVASEFLRKAVKQKPRNTEALIHLGAALAQAGDYAAAKDSLEKALKIAPTNASASANLGLVLVALQDWKAAEKYLKRATVLDAANFDAWLNLANVLSQTGRCPEALQAYRQAALLRPGDIRIALGESATLMKMASFQQAVVVVERALASMPDVPELLENKALALKGLGDIAGALSVLQQAHSLNPLNPGVLSNLGDIYNDMGMPEEAIDACLKAVEIAPELAAAYNNLGLAYVSTGRYENSIQAYQSAIANNPQFSQAYNNLGIALTYLGQVEEALKNLDQAISLDASNAHARMTKAVTLLAQGRYTEGWQLYGARFDVRGEPEQVDTWQGKTFNGRLVVTPEQGVGDQILFASMFSELARVHEDILVRLDPRLIPLFSRSFSGISFVSKDQDLPLSLADRSVAMGTLGKYFRATAEDFARTSVGYLTADSLWVDTIRRRFQDGRLKVGISWRSAEKKYGAKKSLPLSEWLPMLSLPNIEFVDLQYGDTASERADFYREHGVSIRKQDDIDNMQDLDGLAALIKSCDVVVTTSNSTAHLSGALGMPTLVLVPNGEGRLWYWNGIAGHSNWYPTVKMMRMPNHGDWVAPINMLQDMLTQVRGT